MKVNKFVFTDGHKTVEYIGMVHVAPENFYKKVSVLIQTSKSEIHLHEGVKKADVELPHWFEFVSQDGIFRQAIKKCTGWEVQDQKHLNTFHHNNFNSDICVSKIIECGDLDFDQLTEEEYETFKGMTEYLVSGKFTARVISFFIGSFLRNFLKFNNMKSFNGSDMSQDIAKIIGYERSKILAGDIIACEEENILVTYGTAHWKETLEILQEDDPNWRLKKKERF